MMPNKRICAVLIGPIAALAFASAASARMPSHAAVLPISAAPSLLKQCSRPTVDHVDSFWTPSEADVWAVEGRLRSFLKQPGTRAPEAPLDQYYRQYIGVVSKGRRLIYVAFFHESFLKNSPRNWQQQPVDVCDGGDYFWGIVFDPSKQIFERPKFNGLAQALPNHWLEPTAIERKPRFTDPRGDLLIAAAVQPKR